VQIVVNHLTRMTVPRICIAGLETSTETHVRPVTAKDDPITRDMLRSSGGPFRVGAVVDLGRVIPRPDPPETEDHLFATRNAMLVRDLGGEEYLDLLERACGDDLHDAFRPDLSEPRPGKLAVPAGTGGRSLVVVRATGAVLRVEYGRLYLSLQSARLRVTDLRFYEADHTTLKRSIVDDVRGRLSRGQPAYAMIGLAREMKTPRPDASTG
jgi:hypothetical protein